MRRRFTWFLLFSAAILVAGLYYTRSAWATKASGFTSTPLTPFQSARLPEFEVFNHLVAPGSEEEDHNVWLSFQKTKGDSDLYVQSNVWQPGGSTGWHTHPGHSLIIVTAGTVTAYMGNDPSFTPTCTRSEARLWTQADTRCTSSGTKAPATWHRPSRSSFFRQASRVALM